MDISSLIRNVSAANLPLEKLAGSTQVSEQDKIAEVSRQFEAVLLRQILTQAQKPIAQGATSGVGGSGNAIYQDLATQQLADRISQGGSFGFARELEKQLAGQYIKKEAAKEGLQSAAAPKRFTESTHGAQQLAAGRPKQTVAPNGNSPKTALKPAVTHSNLKPLAADNSMKYRLHTAPASSAMKSTDAREQSGKRNL